MKHSLPILFALSFGFSEAAAQQVIPPLKREFLDSAWQVLPSAAGARYRRESEWRDSTAGEVRDYYLSNDQLQSREAFEHVRKRTYHGVSEYYYADGKLKTRTEYTHGQRSGELLMYYPGGQLKRRERYSGPGLSSGGECFDPAGKPLPFFVFEVMPRYSRGDGGPQAIVQDIARNFRYPRDARRQGIEGRTFVRFNVTEKGEVADVQVLKPLFPSIDAAATQAVYQLAPFRPGQQDGKPVRVSFTVPLTLRLQ